MCTLTEAKYLMAYIPTNNARNSCIHSCVNAIFQEWKIKKITTYFKFSVKENFEPD